MNIANRIVQIRDSRSRRSFAELLGITESTLRNYENGASLPNSDLIAEMCKKMRINTEWLLFGTGTMHAHEAQPTSTVTTTTEKVVQQPHKLEVLNCFDCEIVMVPMVEAILSAGTGSFETGGMTDRRYAFRSDFLRRKGAPSSMILMRVAGDSMEPEIKDNDVVLIDQSNTRLSPHSIFAIAVEDMVYLKRVNAMPGKIILSSINEQYPPIEYDATGDLEESIRIVGKVIWSCREL